MRRFETISSIITPLLRINVDTDQIIPKQFLRLVKSSGFGDCLFYGWRYNADGTKDASFPLNDTRYDGSRILVAGENFGCGSSREHAVWALRDYGFVAVIAPSFADIFASNCIKSGFLPVRLDQDAVDKIAASKSPVKIDLKSRRVTAPGAGSWDFEIGDYAQRMLLEGLDEIDLTLEHINKIDAYEQAHCAPPS